jgi:hypothetical protein
VPSNLLLAAMPDALHVFQRQPCILNFPAFVMAGNYGGLSVVEFHNQRLFLFEIATAIEISKKNVAYLVGKQ